MLQAAYIAQNRDTVVAGLQKKNFKDTDKVDQIIALDEKRRKMKYELDELLAQQNTIAKMPDHNLRPLKTISLRQTHRLAAT